jgi:hypothetical protein
MYGDNYTVAPFSVLLDPVRALRVLGVEEGRAFSPKVHYVYEKQLEEADIIAINKIDAVSPERVTRLRRALEERYPRAAIYAVSARTGAGLDAWFSRIVSSDDTASANIDIDYDTYAEGEALLGWINCTANLSGAPIDGNAWLMCLATDLQRRLDTRGIEIAHLKMTLSPDEGDDLGVVNVVSTSAPPAAPFLLQAPVTASELVINLRGEGDPDMLRLATMEALTARAAGAGLRTNITHAEHFRPGRPVPTHRVVMTP